MLVTDVLKLRAAVAFSSTTWCGIQQLCRQDGGTLL